MGYREERMAKDDIHCHNREKADIRFHDGGLRHVVGACSYQVVRAAKKLSLSPEGRGFTYNHAGMLTYFHGTFIYEYLGGPSGEHEAPSAVFVCFSKDGIHWDRPVEAFPPRDVSAAPYRGPKGEYIKTERIPCIVHHRMGFYRARNGRQLMTTFYGVSPDSHTAPNNGYGVGRVVREIYPDLTMSDIWFLKYNVAGGYGKEQVDFFDDYRNSQDAGFVEACEELLANRLVTQQWWEEERLDAGYFTRPDGRALSYYTLPGGRVMGVFKDSMTSYSDDGGESWSELKKSVSIETSSGKVWGQKTPDGRYALVYNPTPDSAHRWPLAMVTGDNGVDFDELLAILPEVSPCRYEGKLKNLGPQYMRGITEANEAPDDMAMWIVYSVNKEDMWISRIPVPVKAVWTEDVEDDMSLISDETLRNTWNLYVPSWNQAELCTVNGTRALKLTDCDLYNRTRAMRCFRPGSLVKAVVRLMVEALPRDKFSMFLQDGHGQNIISAVVRSDGWICMRNAGLETPLCEYRTGQEIEISIMTDAVENRVWVEAFCGQNHGKAAGYAAASVYQLERMVFATKYDLPFQGLEVNGRNGDIGCLPGADEKQPETVVYLRTVEIETVEE